MHVIFSNFKSNEVKKSVLLDFHCFHIVKKMCSNVWNFILNLRASTYQVFDDSIDEVLEMLCKGRIIISELISYNWSGSAYFRY